MRFASIFIIFFITYFLLRNFYVFVFMFFARKTLAQLLYGRFFCLHNNASAFF